MYHAAVFFDLDGTLLDSRKKIQISSLKAIHQLKVNHILPVIATGRNLSMVRPIMKKAAISSVISADGSYIQFHHQPLTMVPIPRTVVEKLVQMAAIYHHPLAFQTGDQIVLNSVNELTQKAYLHHTITPSVDASFYQRHHVNFINLFTTNRDQVYQNAFHHQLNIVRNSDKCLDVVKSGVSKRSGIQALLGKLNLLSIPTYAFGDGLNDIEMFQTVTHAIAMANGVKECQANADWVTSSNDHDGIANGLRHFHLVTD